MKPAHFVSGFVLLGAALALPVGAAGGAPGGGKTPAAAVKPTATPKTVLPFVLDDYAKAVQEARASKRPLFIETWAPW